MIRRLAFASLILAGVAGCDSLTTPESTTEEVNLLVVPQAGSPTNDSTLITGDTLAYDVFQVTQTAVIVPLSQRWSVTDTSRVRVLNGNTGRFFVRRTGRDTIIVEAVVSTAAGNVALVARRPVRSILELFFGTFTPTTVAFRDLMIVEAPTGGEQPLTASTQILFAPDPAASNLQFIAGIPIVRSADSLIAVVPAGFATGPVLLTSIAADRDLLARQQITRANGDNDLDPFDRADSTEITLPFLDALSVHDSLDVDVYGFSVDAATPVVIDFAWNVPSDLDFVLETFDILGQRVEVLRGDVADTEREGPYSQTLQPGRYELTLQAKTYAGPTTYLMSLLTP